MRGIYKRDIRSSIDKLIDSPFITDEWDNTRKSLVGIELTPAEFDEFLTALNHFAKGEGEFGKVVYRDIPITRRVI